jgi:outer membrane PBP1 activator LpoA protein
MTSAEADEPVSANPGDSGSPIIYQFDLAPETEALQAAERAIRENFSRAMVMVPENVWGNRLYEAFTSRYEQLGGSVVTLDRFEKGTSDFSSGIKNRLNLEISKIRHKQLQSFLGRKLGFTPRRRKDIDVIFIAASPQEARLIKPQLKFFYASDIPVYATSNVYTGTPNASRDKDLENIVFCDMPWLLDDKPAPGSLHRTIQTSWPENSGKYMRFFALGADAFLLLPQLEWLQNNQNDWISGGTGKLSLDDTGTVHRQLSWATFKDGVPRVIE